MPRRRTATVSTTGTPSSLLERLRVELEPVALGEIDHVERDDRRQAELDQLQREAEMIVEVGGVEDDHQSVGLTLALLAAEQDVAGHRFVGARRVEAVGAGQVDQLDRAAVGERDRDGVGSALQQGPAPAAGTEAEQSGSSNMAWPAREELKPAGLKWPAGERRAGVRSLVLEPLVLELLVRAVGHRLGDGLADHVLQSRVRLADRTGDTGAVDGVVALLASAIFLQRDPCPSLRKSSEGERVGDDIVEATVGRVEIGLFLGRDRGARSQILVEFLES